MAKASSDKVLDGTLDISATATLMIACSAQPTTRAEAVTTFALADVVMAGGDFTKANGDVSGRKVTHAQKSSVTIDTSGEADHVATVDGTDLLNVTTCTPLALTAGGTVTFPAWKQEIADPTP